MMSFKKEKIFLPRLSYEMVKKGNEINLKNVKKGDLLFFKTDPNTPNRVSYVGLVTKKNTEIIKFIHSTSKRGVVESRIDESYYQKSFFKAKRILY